MKAITLKVDTCEHCGAYCLTRNMRDIGYVPYCRQCYAYFDEEGELQTCERCEAVDFYATMARFDLCDNCVDDLYS